MPRPRVHDLDAVLDVVEHLAVDRGPAAVTVRAVAEVTAMSNGAIYHAFGSRAGLVGAAWLRAARRFLDLQRTAVDAVFAASPGEQPRVAVDAVVAAADAPAVFAHEHPRSSRFLLDVRRGDLLGSDLPDDLARELTELDAVLVALFVRLSRALWGRGDGQAVAAIEACVVGLPTGLLLRGRGVPDDAMRQRLDAAVRAVLALTPPPVTRRGTDKKESS